MAIMNYLHSALLELGFNKNEFSGIKILPIEELESKMETYISALLEYNAKFDLINADTHDEVAIRHILDSLSALPEICSQISQRFSSVIEPVETTQKSNLLFADIGSGAGLPGIPLAAALPDFKFVLIERMTKRCGFLNHCAEILNLKNVSVEENQAERLEQNRFDMCVFRAFRPLDKKMAKVLLRILKPEGFLAAYKAKREKIVEEMENLPQKPKYKIMPLKVPFLTENSGNEDERERNLVIIQKNSVV